MSPRPSLLQRAEQLLAGAALGTLAIAPLAADATLLATSDLTVEGAGTYYYNSSGYFTAYNGTPAGAASQTVNPDGSAKFYGDASASAADFQAHSCLPPPSDFCARVGDRGVALVWWGTLKQPVQLGDQLQLDYDFSVNLPDLDGSWLISASLSQGLPGNSLSSGRRGEASGSLAVGSHDVTGTLTTRAIETWELDADYGYWQIVATASAVLGNYSRDSGSYAFGGVGLTVPQHSIDVSIINPNDPVPGPQLPLPGSLSLALAALVAAGMAHRLRRRRG